MPLAKRDIIDSNEAQEANDWKFNPVKAAQQRGRAGAEPQQEAESDAISVTQG